MKKIRAKPLVLCYSIFVLASALLCLIAFGADGVGRLTGSISAAVVPLEECELSGLEAEEDGSWRITDADPQIILPENSGPVRQVLLEMDCDADPGEMNLYYTARPGEDFSVRRQVWAAREGENGYRFTLPFGPSARVRLDPGNAVSARLVIHSITINPPRSFFSYFAPSWTWLLAAAVLPGLFASALDWLLFALAVCKGKRPGRE